MISKKIFNILILLIIIAIIIYFYYNDTGDKNVITKKKSVNKPKRSNRKIIKKKKCSQKSNQKKVRFNDNVKYYYYDVNEQADDKIDIDRILNKKKVAPGLLKETKSVEIMPTVDGGGTFAEQIVPMNQEQGNADDTWDANFGLPLITKKESHNHFDKMQKSNRKYEQSMSDFTEYQVDRSSLVEPEFKIDPFKPSTKSATLKNQKIKDIYDMQVAAPTAAPKKIKKVTSDLITYENDSENNGGLIQGTNLHGFDGHNNIFGSAAFGNEF